PGTRPGRAPGPPIGKPARAPRPRPGSVAPANRSPGAPGWGPAGGGNVPPSPDGSDERRSGAGSGSVGSEGAPAGEKAGSVRPAAGAARRAGFVWASASAAAGRAAWALAPFTSGASGPDSPTIARHIATAKSW